MEPITMSFSEALDKLKSGFFSKIFRLGWNGVGMHVSLQQPDEHSANTLPYVYIEAPKESPVCPDGFRVPWLPSQHDLMKDDWQGLT